jgi:hypothetical protein
MAATIIKGFFTNAFVEMCLNSGMRNIAFTQGIVSIGLSKNNADRLGSFSEPSGGSYARVAVPAVSWSTAGTPGPHQMWNTAAVNFPAPTADWTTAGTNQRIRSLFAINVTTSMIIWTADLATPVQVLSGGAARSFAINSILISM